MPWAEETGDVIGNFIARFPLYQRLPLADYYVETGEDEDTHEVVPISQVDPILRYCQSSRCKAERPYKRTLYQKGMSRGQYVGRIGTQVSTLMYNCTNCGAEYWCWVEASERFAEGDIWIRKIGQLPPYDISIASDLQNALREDAILYKRAQICMSQSFGIAACSYLRRLLENQITPLLESVYEVRKEEGEDVGELLELLAEKVAENKIRLANNVLPSLLEVPGDNPLELIYDKLSAGLHRQSEQECMEIATEASQILRYVIVSINDDYERRQSKNRYAELIRGLREARRLRRYPSPRPSAAERFVQPVHGIVAHAFHEVRVGVHRLRDRGVAEQGLHDLRVLAPLEERGGEGVAQGMEREALIFESGPLEERLVVAVIEVIVVHRAADTVGEDDTLVPPIGVASLSSF